MAQLPENQWFEGESQFKFLGLSRTQRLYGFAGCLIAGFTLSLLGTIMLVLGQVTVFARELLSRNIVDVHGLISLNLLRSVVCSRCHHFDYWNRVLDWCMYHHTS